MTLAHSLTTLESSGLIRLAQLEPELEYLFRHALVQDATYESILKTDRQVLHRIVAETLEQLFPEQLDTLAFLLGQHWREAGKFEHARVYFIRAGDVARKSYANQEAIAAYTEALALTSDSTQRFDLIAARVEVYDIVAIRDKQKADIDALLDLSKKIDDNTRYCDALLAHAKFYLETDHIRSQEPTEQAIAVAHTISDKLREARGLHVLGEVVFSQRKFSQSRIVFEKVITYFREMNQLPELASSLNKLSLILGELNELAASQKAIEEAIDLNRTLGDQRQEAVNLRRLATIEVNLGHYAKALPFADASLALSRQLGDRANECSALNSLGYIYSGLRRIEVAKKYYLESLEIAEAIQHQFSIRTAVSSLADIYKYLGEHQAGLAFLEIQLIKVEQIRDEYLIGLFKSIQGNILYELGQYERALELRQSRLKLGRKLSGNFNTADLSFIGLMQAELGKFSEAQETLRTAFEQEETMDNPYKAALILSISAHLIWLKNDQKEMQTGLSLAIKALESLSNRNSPTEMVNALEIASRLHLSQDEKDKALICSSESVRIVKTTPYFWRIEKIFLTHFHALRVNGHDAEADKYLQKAYDHVMLVASKTKDETLRQSWLENVRDNREIIAEWNARNPTPGT